MHTFFPTPSDDGFPDGVPDDLDSQVSELLNSVDTEATHGMQSGSHPDDSAESVDAEGYWALSRTPLTSLVFTLPLVLAYEGGVLLLGRSSPQRCRCVAASLARCDWVWVVFFAAVVDAPWPACLAPF